MADEQELGKTDSIISKLEDKTFVIGFFVLVIYMLDRSIMAIIDPTTSKILGNIPQKEANELYLIELPYVTSYATNSILFPIVLLLLYRLANIHLKKLLVTTIILHYLSVAIVSTPIFYTAVTETSKYVNSKKLFETSDGVIYESHSDYGYKPLIEDGELHQTLRLYTDITKGEFLAYQERDLDEDRVYGKSKQYTLTAFEYCEHFYSPTLSLLFVVLGACCLKYIGTIDLKTLLEREK